jgi:hypothetical protein
LQIHALFRPEGQKASETMRRNTVVKFRNPAPEEDFGEPRTMLRNRPQYAGVHADYRREDYVFARTQSPQMQEMAWERAAPLKHWGSNMIANLAWEIFA